LFKKDDYENPVVYNGGRSVSDWKKYLEEQFPADTKTDL